jgi:signal peptidase I
MFDFRRKNQFEFGGFEAMDDRGIEVQKLRRESRQGLWHETLRLTRDVFMIVVVFVLVGVFIAQPVVVEGTSMVPQLHDGERLLVNKLIYYKFKSVSWGHIERGDIVVFWYPNDPDKSYVKRVIGLPGETVAIQNGKVFINDKQLNESYLDSEHNKSLNSIGPKTIDQHHFFVMGDNRDNSSDSRVWGFVPEKYIYGKAFFRYWSPSSIGFLQHGTYNIDDAETIDDFRAEGDR